MATNGDSSSPVRDLLRSSLRSNASVQMKSEHCTIVHEGWLMKSPPEKRIWKSKWRQRYFILKQGSLPGQYLLEYYEDSKCKKHRGTINLDDCEQVDAGLTLEVESSGKATKYVFDVRTSQRLYYLATKTEEEMKQWVDAICHVCGLKVREDNNDNNNMNRYSPCPSSDQSGSGVTVYTALGDQSVSGATGGAISPTKSGLVLVQSDSPGKGNGFTSRTRSSCFENKEPRNPNTGRATKSGSHLAGRLESMNMGNYSQPRSSKSISVLGNGLIKDEESNEQQLSKESDNPYIPISECRSGRPVQSEVGVPPPRPPKPATLRRSRGKRSETDSVLDHPGDECKSKNVYCDLYDSKAEDNSAIRSCSSLTHPQVCNEPILTMKVPLHTSVKSAPSATEINGNLPAKASDSSAINDKKPPAVQAPLLDQMYSFPKPVDLWTQVVPPPTASTIHPYFNSAPGRCVTKENIFNYDFRPSLPTSSSMSPDLQQHNSTPDRSPRTPIVTVMAAPPIEIPPPLVNRNLKPRRRSTNSSTSISPKNERRSPRVVSEKQKKKEGKLELQYLDLDLDSSDGSSPRTPNLDKDGNSMSKMTHNSPSRDGIDRDAAAKASSVYKEVDFVRTDALNKMRHERTEVKVTH